MAALVNEFQQPTFNKYGNIGVQGHVASRRGGVIVRMDSHRKIESNRHLEPIDAILMLSLVIVGLGAAALTMTDKGLGRYIGALIFLMCLYFGFIFNNQNKQNK